MRANIQDIKSDSKTKIIPFSRVNFVENARDCVWAALCARAHVSTDSGDQFTITILLSDFLFYFHCFCERSVKTLIYFLFSTHKIISLTLNKHCINEIMQFDLKTLLYVATFTRRT